MKAIKLVTLIFLLAFVKNLYPQQLKGVVVNETNQPLEAAYVYNLNSKSHAHTSENGVFIIDDNDVGDSLKVGLLGFENKNIILSASDFNTTIRIQL